jgi:WD repeat-containing protein 21A
MLQRGAVQSYEGHVNSHTQIQLGVDPDERYVMSGRWYFSDVISLTFLFENSDLVISGGEDCKLRIWSIKSGELLLEDKFSNSVLSTVCYQSFKSSKHDMLLGLSAFSFIYSPVHSQHF